jgi:transcriptional regulator with XRE-family HTH domain
VETVLGHSGGALHNIRDGHPGPLSVDCKVCDLAGMKKPSEGISAAIRAMRVRLGETQAGMARLLGVSLRTYDRWEAGHTVPRGNILVKLMDLCPDDYARLLFRDAATSNVPRTQESREALSPAGRSNPEGRLRMRLRNSCLEAIEIIYESAVLGSIAADEKLRSYADELNRSAAILAKGLVENRKLLANKAATDSLSADES